MMTMIPIKIFSKKKRSELFALIPIFLALFACYPYVFSQFLHLPSVVVISALLLGYMIFLNFSNSNNANVSKSLNICVIIQSIVWFLYYLYHNDTSYITRIVFTIIIFYTIVTLNKLGLEKRFSYYNTCWISLQAVLAMIAFILCFMGILSPIFSFYNFDTRPVYFFGISCTNVLYGNLARMAGYFDEPGALATWGIFALVFNKVFYKKRLIEYLLIGCLFCTLSLAYYVLLVLYLVFFYYRNIVRIIPIIGICCVALWFASTQGTVDSKLYELTFERVEQSKQGDYGRNELSDRARKYFIQAPIFGNGAKNMEAHDYIGDNYLETFAKDGIIGSIVLYLPLIVVIFSSSCRRNREILFGCLLLIACYWQRPFHINLMHYIMLYSFCSLALLNNVKNNSYE